MCLRSAPEGVVSRVRTTRASEDTGGKSLSAASSSTVREVKRDRRYRNTREKMPPFALCPFSRVTSVEQREVRAELSLCKDGKLRLKAAL